mmetsp:Transcript_30730/g.71809  ORF Transcript_30730/g.71809 Transcript_30730/m.71809 type:complete len:128 (-) Transcript_30730:31-414(-)
MIDHGSRSTATCAEVPPRSSEKEAEAGVNLRCSFASLPACSREATAILQGLAAQGNHNNITAARRIACIVNYNLVSLPVRDDAEFEGPCLSTKSCDMEVNNSGLPGSRFRTPCSLPAVCRAHFAVLL